MVIGSWPLTRWPVSSTSIPQKAPSIIVFHWFGWHSSVGQNLSMKRMDDFPAYGGISSTLNAALHGVIVRDDEPRIKLRWLSSAGWPSPFFSSIYTRGLTSAPVWTSWTSPLLLLVSAPLLYQSRPKMGNMVGEHLLMCQRKRCASIFSQQSQLFGTSTSAKLIGSIFSTVLKHMPRKPLLAAEKFLHWLTKGEKSNLNGS